MSDTPHHIELDPQQALDQQALNRITDATGFELAPDLRALDFRGETPQTSELAPGVTSILDAKSLREPEHVEETGFSILEAQVFIEPDPAKAIRRKDLGTVAVSHDAVMKSTRAHDLDPKSIRGRRTLALQRLEESGRAKKHREVPVQADRVIDNVTDIAIGAARRLLGETGANRNDPRSLGPIKSHRKPKF